MRISKLGFMSSLPNTPQVLTTDCGHIRHANLITMDIDTRDSPHIMKRHHNLHLKHSAWVQEELETLEKDDIIVRSISPWTSPAVVVPKQIQQGKPPRRKLHVDYSAINNLLPPVTKAHS